jgi:aminoacrylate peracid reductase
MPYMVIVPKGSAPLLAPYSLGTKAGNVVYVSGTLALDSNGSLVGEGDVKAQTRHILETMRCSKRRVAR